MNRLYNIGLPFIAAVSLLTLLASLTAINAFSFIYEGSFYPFTLPTVFVAAFCFLLSALALAKVVARRISFWLVVSVGSSAFIMSRYAMAFWPGGDDGPGMLWLLLVGFGSALLSLSSIVMFILGAAISYKTRNDT
jgi:hypothetical protein